MLDLHRNWFKGLESKTADVFAVLPLAPNHYTSASIIFAVACAFEIYSANYLWALGLFLAAAFLDLVDGAVARRKNLSTSKGAYWDTIADRYVEAIILLGLLAVDLPEFYLPAYVWIFLVLFGSTMTTYAKAAAREKGLSDTELKGGLMSRAERFISYGILLLLLIGGFRQWAVMVAALLAILSNLTAVQRVSMALRKN
jgi:archaetidylinositol phosphate synthase